MNTDGSAQEEIVSLSEDEEDVVYYASLGLNPYRYDINMTDSGKIYFSAGAGKGIYTVTDFSEKVGIEAIYTEEAYTFQIAGDKIYLDIKTYSDEKVPETGLYTLALQGGDPEQIEKIRLGTGAFFVKEDTVYFDGCPTENPEAYGIYALHLKTGALQKLSDLRASDIYVSEDRLYLYLPDKNGAYLKVTALDGSGETSIF